MNNQYTDDELIAALQAGGTPMQEAMRYVYLESGWRQKILNLVRYKGGTKEEGEDLFQKMILIFWNNVRKGKYKGTGSLEAYFMQMCRNKWFSRFNQIVQTRSNEDALPPRDENPVPSPDKLLLVAERKTQLDVVYDSLGKGCKDVLGLRFLGFKPAEIAEKTGYKDASKRFSECKKKLTALLLKRPEIVHLLKGN